MAYRFNGVECDTFEELQRLRGSARTTSAVVKETRKGKCKPSVHYHESKAGSCVENSGRTPAPTGIYEVGSRDWGRPGGDH